MRLLNTKDKSNVPTEDVEITLAAIQTVYNGYMSSVKQPNHLGNAMMVTTLLSKIHYIIIYIIYQGNTYVTLKASATI